jgi:cytochrome subunit of sulfide dehydrogenase
MARRVVTGMAVGWLGVAGLVGHAAAPATAAPAVAPPGAASCSGCHVPAGAAATAIPSPYRLSSAEIEAALLAFKSGARPATVMDRIARGFSDQELAQLAAWLGQGR